MVRSQLKVRRRVRPGHQAQPERAAAEALRERTVVPNVSNPLVQALGQLGDAASVHAHAALLKRAPASQPVPAREALLLLQQRYGNRYVQRVVTLARQSSDAPEVAPAIQAALEQRRGSGQGLDGQVRPQMEAAFGVDFGGVRVHADTEADTLNRSLNARAFTTGQDIYFRQGGYSPGSSSGRELIAHELVHVVQQTGAVQRKRTVSQPGDRSEQAADLMAHLVMRQEQQTTPGTEEDRQPTEAEKAAALAAAQAAEHMADQAAATGKAAVEKSRAAEATESEAEQAAAQDVAAAQTAGAMAVAEAEAPPAEAEEAEQSASEEAAPAPVAGAGPVVGVAGLEDKAPTSPDADPAFQAVLATIQAVAVSQQAHAPATTKAAEAQAAAVAPPSEVTGRAQANQVGEMEAMETPEFDAAAFKAELMKRIAALAPKTTAEADNFKRDNQLGSVKAEMQGQVAQEQTATQTPLEEKTAQAPDTSQIEPKPVTPLPPGHPGAPPPDVGAAQAVPKLKGHSEVEAPLHANSQKLDQQMAEADITEEQLATSNEPTFTAALGAKRTAQAHAAAAPQPYRQFEQEQLGQAEAEAVAMALDQTQAMHGSRAELLHQVEAQQGQAKSKDEQAREKVAADIQAMYDTTKTRVDTILSDLDGKVAQAFDTGAAAAKKAFEDYVAAKMEAYKKRRYGGWLGWARWAKDKLLGMPAAVNAFYQQGRQLFLDKMNAVLDNVVAIIGTGLTAAKAEIAQGKQHIQNYLDQLPTNLQAVGQQAAQDIQGQFEALEQSVNDKQHELIDNLANKYQENLQAVDARIEELKAANQGLVDKAINAVVGVIKTILKLKEMLTRVLAKVAGVVGLILRDPIGFLGNLVSGLKQGFENFVGNILSHLQTGLIGWLTGTLGPMGVQLPEDLFSVQGIFSLVMQVLGLTWDYIRQKAVKLLGEPVVKALETGFAPFQILLKEGPAGLWQYVKEQFQDLKEAVLEQIKDMVITEVIKAGVKWVMGLLSPVGAFIKAAMAIYDIVMFFIDRASEILEFIHAVVDAIAAIAQGAVSSAAKLVENALAKAIPLVIGLLASILGLRNLPKRIQGIIQRIRSRIDKAIDSLIGRAKKAALRLFKGRQGTEKQGDGRIGDGEVGETITFSARDQGHRLWFNVRGTSVTVMVASQSDTVAHKIKDWQSRLKDLTDQQRDEAERLLSVASERFGLTDIQGKKAAAEKTEAEQNPASQTAEAEFAQADNEAEQAEQSLAQVLRQLFEIFGDKDIPIALDEPEGLVKAWGQSQVLLNRTRSQSDEAMRGQEEIGSSRDQEITRREHELRIVQDPKSSIRGVNPAWDQYVRGLEEQIGVIKRHKPQQNIEELKRDQPVLDVLLEEWHAADKERIEIQHFDESERAGLYKDLQPKFEEIRQKLEEFGEKLAKKLQRMAISFEQLKRPDKHSKDYLQWCKGRKQDNPDSDTTIRFYQNQTMTAAAFIGEFRKGGISEVMPPEAETMTVDEVLQGTGLVGGVNLRKLIGDTREKFE